MVRTGTSLRVVAFVLVLITGEGSGSAIAALPTEYEVKAAYLYYLATFIEWPKGAFTSDADPFVIGILGEDPFGQVLDETLRGKTVRGRKLLLRRFPSLTAEMHCHLLFISASEEGHLADVLKTLENLNVLTVSEIAHFADRGGHIGLRLDERKVRFSLNLDATQRARLKVSAQLLKLATPPVQGGATPSSG